MCSIRHLCESPGAGSTLRERSRSPHRDAIRPTADEDRSTSASDPVRWSAGRAPPAPRYPRAWLARVKIRARPIRGGRPRVISSPTRRHWRGRTPPRNGRAVRHAPAYRSAGTRSHGPAHAGSESAMAASASGATVGPAMWPRAEGRQTEKPAMRPSASRRRSGPPRGERPAAGPGRRRPPHDRAPRWRASRPRPPDCTRGSSRAAAAFTMPWYCVLPPVTRNPPIRRGAGPPPWR